MSYIVLGGAGATGRAIVKFLRQSTEQMVVSIDPAGSHIVSDKYIGWQGRFQAFTARYKPLIKGSVIISCLSPKENDALVYQAEHMGAIGFIDLGGDDACTALARRRKRPYFLTRVLDCGLAPGIVSSIAAQAVLQGKQHVEIYCGGLRATQSICEPDFGHALSFSPEGLYQELTGTAQVILGGCLRRVPTLHDIEYIEALGLTISHLWPMEAAYTSGGLSSTPEMFVNNLKTLTYKTVRPTSHFKFLKQHILWREKSDAIRTMSEIFPRVSKLIPDVVILGVRYDQQPPCTWYRWDYDKENDISAMAQATGYVVAAVATMVYQEIFPRGILSMHDISFHDIVEAVHHEMPDQFKIMRP